MKYLTLRFRIFDIPVTVDPGFWIIALIFGLTASGKALIIWIIAVFVGVLVHELGHALMAKRFGAQPDITLYMMGGVTHANLPQHKRLDRLASALVTLAGPGAGFLLGALAFVWLLVTMPQGNSLSSQAALVVLWINWGWGAINLIPVFPLDGGNLMRALLSGPNEDAGYRRALWVSVIVGPAVTIASVVYEWNWSAVLFAYFTYTSAKQLYQMATVRADLMAKLDEKLQRVQQALKQGEFRVAWQLGEQVAKQAKTRAVRIVAIHLTASALLEDQKPHEAIKLLEALPPDKVDPLLWSRCLLDAGQPEQAAEALQHVVNESDSELAHALLEQAKAQMDKESVVTGQKS